MFEPQVSSFKTEQERKFNIGPGKEIEAHQKGRIVKLSDPTTPFYDKTYLVDVTDSHDLSRQNHGDPRGDLVEEIFHEELGRTAYNDKFCINQGVSVVITDKLDYAGRKRVYLGIPVLAQEGSINREITQLIFLKAGFERDGLYIPFTAQQASRRDLTREWIKEQILSAVSGNPFQNGELLEKVLRIC